MLFLSAKTVVSRKCFLPLILVVAAVFAFSNIQSQNIFQGGSAAGDSKSCFSQEDPTTVVSGGPNNNIFTGGLGSGYDIECFSQADPTTVVSGGPNNNVFIGGLGSGDNMSCNPDTIPLENCITGLAIDSIVITDASCATSSDGTAAVFISGGVGPFSIQWSDPATQTTDTAVGLPSGRYQVVVTGTSCTLNKTDSVGASPPIVASITGTDTICYGDTTLLIASGGSTYLWSTGATNDSIWVSPTTDSLFSVDVSIGVCNDNSSITVIVNPLPIPIITITDDSICPGDSASLIASGGVYTYLWGTGETTDTIRVSPPVDSIYTLTATDTNGCVAATQDTIIINPVPSASITAVSDSICLGDSLTLTASPGGAGMTYLWNTGATTQTIRVGPAVDSTYSVTVTNSFGCIDSTASFSLTIVSIVTSISGVTNLCVGGSTTLTASAVGAISYLWDIGETTPSIIVSPIVNTTYSVTTTNLFGCADSSASITVTADTCSGSLIFIGGSASGSTMECFSQIDPVPVVSGGPNNNVFTGGLGAGYDMECFSQDFVTAVVPGTNNNVFTGGIAAGFFMDCYSQSIPADTATVLPSGGGGGASGGSFTLCSGTFISLTLPIELVNFTAVPFGNQVQLDWATSSEINNNFFTIDKTKDAKTFKEVVKVDGAGNSNTILHYQAFDDSPYQGTSYYRLKQTDYDGKYKYSKLVAVTFDQNLKGMFLYPNPASQEVTISFYGFTGDVKVQFYNVLGEKVVDEKCLIDEHNQSHVVSLNDKNLPKGTYFVKAMDVKGEKVFIERLVID